MGCIKFIGDVLGFSIVRNGMKNHPKLTWITLIGFWGWAFVTGMMVVRYAHLGEHPYVFEIMPIASCMSPIVALVGVLFFTIGDAFTNVFSEAFQSSFGVMPFNLYAMLGQPHPLLTWGAYVRLNLVGLMSYALLPGLMGRLFSHLTKGLMGAIIPKRRKPAVVFADGPREWTPGQRERVPQAPGQPPLPHEVLPGELETVPRESMPIDPPPGMKPGDVMVNMGPDSPGQIIRDGVVIQGEGLGTRVDIPGITSPATGVAATTGQSGLQVNDDVNMDGTVAPQQGEVLINQGPNMDGGISQDPGLYDAPGSRAGDIMVNMGPDSPGQIIRDGVVIQGEGMGSQVGMPGATDVGGGMPRPGEEILINEGPNMDGSPLEPTPFDAPGARDGDIMVNMGPDSQGQVIRDGRVIAGEGAEGSFGAAENHDIDARTGRRPTVGSSIPMNSAAELDAQSEHRGGLQNAALESSGGRSGMGTMNNAGLGSQLSSTGAASHDGMGYMPDAWGGRMSGVGLGGQLSSAGLGGQPPASGLGGVLGQSSGLSPTVTGPGSGYLPGLSQVALETGTRSSQIAGMAALGQAAALGQQGMTDVVSGGRRRPKGPKPGWGNEPYRPPQYDEIKSPDPSGFYPETGGGGSGDYIPWTDLIPSYIGAVVGATGGIALGGGIYYGDMWAEYHPIRVLTHPSGSTDPSCFRMDADHAVNNVVAGGTMAPVGGAAVVAGGGTPPVAPPAGPQGPTPPPDDTVEWTSSDGRTHVLEKQPDGNYINILTGGLVAGDNINGWKENYEDNLVRTDDWRQRNDHLQKTGQDAQSQELARIKAESEARQKILDTVGRMEQKVFEGNYGLDEFLGRDGGPGDMMKNLRDIAHQATGRGPVDMAKLNAIGKLYTDTISGRVISENQMPEPDGFGDNVVNTGLETIKQLSTVRGHDGKFSKLALAGRIGADILTGGYAEGLFIPVESLNVAKEYVDAGGDSALEGGLLAAGTAAVNLVGGELIGRGLKAAPGIGRVAGDLGDEIAEGIVSSAKGGSSVAQTAVNMGKATRGAFDAYGRPVINGIKEGVDALNVNLGRAPWEPPVGPGRVARPPVSNADVSSRNPNFVDAPGANVGQHLDGMPPRTQSGVQQVADEHGVLIDMRPGNKLTTQRLNEGCHPKGPDIHNKTINGDDVLLGANSNGEGLVGHYKPKLPENFDSLSRPDQLRIIDRFQQRHSEFVNNHGAISRNPKFEIRDGVIHNKETGRAYTGDNDVMSVRDAATGRLASAEKTNAVMNDLVGANVGVEHNAHMNWNYRGQPTHPVGPNTTISGSSNTSGTISGEWRQSPFQQSRGIDQKIIGSHQAGQAGSTPLLTFGPGGPPRGTLIRGGHLR